MAEIVVRAKSAPASLSAAELRLTGKGKGQILEVGADGKDWGAKVVWPNFAILKIPGITTGKVRKYIEHHMAEDPTDLDWTAAAPVYNIFRLRKWTLRWSALPQGVKNTVIANNGVLTIKAGGYAGPSDYTWQQVKQYFRNLDTGLDETVDL